MISGNTAGGAFDAFLLGGEGEDEISGYNKGPKVHKNANFRKF
jgi:hypothetical protein